MRKGYEFMTYRPPTPEINKVVICHPIFTMFLLLISLILFTLATYTDDIAVFVFMKVTIKFVNYSDNR